MVVGGGVDLAGWGGVGGELGRSYELTCDGLGGGLLAGRVADLRAAGRGGVASGARGPAEASQAGGGAGGQPGGGGGVFDPYGEPTWGEGGEGRGGGGRGW